MLNDAQEHRSLAPSVFGARMYLHSPRGRWAVDSAVLDGGRDRWTSGFDGVPLNILNYERPMPRKSSVVMIQDILALMHDCELQGNKQVHMRGRQDGE